MITEISIEDESAIGHEALPFMDCTTGYNQIKMAPKDQDITAGHTLKCIFSYKVMPFALNNGGVTYERVIQTIFDDNF